MHNRLRLLRLSVLTICLFTLVGCFGFKLRGSYSFPTYLRTVYITPNDPYETFQRELRYRLKRNNIKVLCQATDQITTLEVTKPEIKEEVLAYNSSGQVQRSRLVYSVTYQLITKGKDGFKEKRTITRTRELSKTGNMLLTNESEEQIVRKELLNETINELLRQLTSRPTNNAPVEDTTTTDDNPC